MRCDLCGNRENTVYAEFQHNVGMLFMRRVYTTQADMCSACLRQRFTHHMLSNLTLGWWGTISFIMTWFYLLNNVTTFISKRRELARATPMRASAPAPDFEDGRPPEARMRAFLHNVRTRYLAGDDADAIARDLAKFTNVTEEQARAYCAQVASGLAHEHAQAQQA